MDEMLKQQLKEEVAQFRQKAEQFMRGEINIKEFKGFSGGFGSYAQRGKTHLMLRLRMDQGVMSKEKLAFVCDSCRRHDVDLAHITTCQTIQLHHLSVEAVCDIMEKALDVGIVTRGGGGDYPRNVMCSPLSGVERGEYFDVRPYAEAAGAYLISVMNKRRMPRKLRWPFPARLPMRRMLRSATLDSWRAQTAHLMCIAAEDWAITRRWACAWRQRSHLPVSCITWKR